MRVEDGGRKEEGTARMCRADIDAHRPQVPYCSSTGLRHTHQHIPMLCRRSACRLHEVPLDLVVRIIGMAAPEV